LFTRGAGLVTGRFGRLSRASRLVAELRLPVALVRGRRWGRRASSFRYAVALVGDVVAFVGDPVAFVCDAPTLVRWTWSHRCEVSFRPFAVTSARHLYHLCPG
jgi:hypothetical protein